ncbi:MAG: hypothetical protein H8E30_02430, partial [Alphaproteobacteria bacterium]|nr:hypothetical protein [Alphaproteobacteria bacterium]
MNIRARVIICGILSAFALTPAHAALAGPSADLFGPPEDRHNNLRPFPKSTRLLDRHFADAAPKPGPP